MYSYHCNLSAPDPIYQGLTDLPSEVLERNKQTLELGPPDMIAATAVYITCPSEIDMAIALEYGRATEADKR